MKFLEAMRNFGETAADEPLKSAFDKFAEVCQNIEFLKEGAFEEFGKKIVSHVNDILQNEIKEAKKTWRSYSTMHLELDARSRRFQGKTTGEDGPSEAPRDPKAIQAESDFAAFRAEFRALQIEFEGQLDAVEAKKDFELLLSLCDWMDAQFHYHAQAYARLHALKPYWSEIKSELEKLQKVENVKEQGGESVNPSNE